MTGVRKSGTQEPVLCLRKERVEAQARPLVHAAVLGYTMLTLYNQWREVRPPLRLRARGLQQCRPPAISRAVQPTRSIMWISSSWDRTCALWSKRCSRCGGLSAAVAALSCVRQGTLPPFSPRQRARLPRSPCRHRRIGNSTESAAILICVLALWSLSLGTFLERESAAHKDVRPTAAMCERAVACKRRSQGGVSHRGCTVLCAGTLRAAQTHEEEAAAATARPKG